MLTNGPASTYTTLVVYAATPTTTTTTVTSTSPTLIPYATTPTTTVVPSAPYFDPAYLQISTVESRGKLNFKSGIAAFYLETIIKMMIYKMQDK